jgi:Flp pilus assembly protein TadD
MKRAIELNPSNAPALNYLGYTYAEMGTRLDEAETLVQRAITIEPQDGFYIDSLGWVYYQKGNYKKAAEELERAVDLAGDDPTITEHLADAYQKLGQIKEANHLYHDALSKAKETDQVERLKDKLHVLRDDGRAAQ